MPDRAALNWKRYNPYAQVALTYLRRSLSSWQSIVMMLTWLSLTAILALILNVRDPSDSGAVPSLLLPIVLCGAFLSGYLAYHISEQLVGLQSRLLPNFRRVHLVVACVAVSLMVIALPALLSILLRLHSVGLVAISLLSFGLIFLLMLSRSPWRAVVFMLIGGVFFLGVVFTSSTAASLCSGDLEPVAIVMLGVGIAAILYGGFQVFHIDEDTQTFQMQMIQAEWQKGRMSFGFQPGKSSSSSKLRERLFASQTTGLIQHAQHAAKSPWSRICRWRAGVLPGWAVPVMVLGFCAFYDLVLLFSPDKRSSVSVLIMSVVFCSFIPACLPWAAVRYRRTLWGQYECLLPVDHASYIRQSGLAAVLSQFQYWFICAAIIVLFQQVVFPGYISLLMKLLACSFLCQIGLLGMVAWLLRLRSTHQIASGFIILLPAVIAISFFVGMEQGQTDSWRVLFWAAGGFAVMGLLLAWDAYRRWLVTDFD